jgi:hypothetical protein
MGTSVFCQFTCGNLCKREQAQASGKKIICQKLNKTGPFFLKAVGLMKLKSSKARQVNIVFTI